MATLLTRDQFMKTMEEQLKVLTTMPANAKVCPACLMTYSPDLRYEICYCDYESGDID